MAKQKEYKDSFEEEVKAEGDESLEELGEESEGESDELGDEEEPLEESEEAY